MAKPRSASTSKPRSGVFKNPAVVVALITVVGSIATAFIGKLAGVEISFPQKTATCGAYVEERWTVISGGHWIPEGGFARFTPRGSSRGLLIGGAVVKQGSIEAKIHLPGYKPGCKAHLVYALRENSDSFMTAGLGGEGSAYSMGEYNEGSGWRELGSRGDGESLSNSQIYRVKLVLAEGRTALEIDGREVVKLSREQDAAPSVLGLWVENCDAAEFICTKVCRE